MNSRARPRPLRSRLAAIAWLALPLLPAACTGPAADAVDGAQASEVSFPDTWRFEAGRAPALADSGMVVSTDSFATAAGLEILREGGNAVEAAIATQFALAVVNPEAGNIGGGGFMVARMADDTRFALDYREEAPRGATPDMYVDETGNVTDLGVVGHLASGVPGSVAGMAAAYERYGTLDWSRLLEPAIKLARDGFEVAGRHHSSIGYAADKLSQFPASAAKFLPNGEAPAVGTVFKQPDLARTLQAIADSGASVFYAGWIADSIAAEMERGGGLIDKPSLADYEAKWREPVVANYRGYQVMSMPPASSGGTTLTEILNIVEGFDLGAYAWHSADAIHIAVEAFRRAYADRNYFLGDTDFVDVPLARLTSEAYADTLRAGIAMDSASDSDTFNRVPLAEGTHTTHFSIVDAAGNAVAVTTTLNSGYGSGVVVRGAGFVLNNEMDDFTSQVGVPNIYGLVQGEANAIAPGKRMLSAMTPTVVINPEGKTELVTGTPGGSTIITTVFQIVSNHIDFHLPAQTSVDAPRFHHQHLPDEIRYEHGGLPDSVVEALRSRGHEVRERGGVSGNVESIYIRPDGKLVGAADPRRDSKAMGY